MDIEHIGLQDLGHNVSSVMARVKNGEKLIVTEHGVPVARLIPLADNRTREQRIADGDAHPSTDWLEKLLAIEPLELPGAPLSEEILAELRDERV